MPIDWPAAREHATAGLASPLFLTPTGPQNRPTAAHSPGHHTNPPQTLINTLAGLSDQHKHLHLTELIQTHAATVLGMNNPTDIDPNRPFNEIGFESLSAVELRNRLQHQTGLHLPATLIFDHPTVHAVASFILAEIRTEYLPPVSIIDEFDRFDRLLAEVGTDQSRRTEIAEKLRALLAKWDGETSQHGSGTTDLDLRSASAEEIFGFLDGDLSD
jgi:acyl carrier protein